VPSNTSGFNTSVYSSPCFYSSSGITFESSIYSVTSVITYKADEFSSMILRDSYSRAYLSFNTPLS